MVPFPFNENQFSFFVANHLLVCVQIARAIGAFYHVWKWQNVQQARLEIRRCTTHALYRSKLWQQDHCQHPQNANPDSSTLEGTAQHIRRPFGGGGAESHIMPPHIFEVGLKVNTKVYLDVLKSMVIPWCNQVAGGSRTWRWPTSPKRPRLGFRRSATTLYHSLTGPLLPWPETAGLLCLVIRQEHHQHDLPQQQSQPDRHHPSRIRRAPAGTCEKGMLQVLDPYRSGDWGWRRLH